MRNVLEKDDYNKFMLFSYMEGTTNQTVTISNIEDRFSLTYFKAVKLVDELMNDFDDLNLEDFFYIEKKKKAYTYSKNGFDSINRLLWIYGRRSLKMSLIDYFLKYEGRSIEEFSFDYYISLSKAYRIRNEANDFLDSYGFNFLKSKEYSEKNLRFFLAELYFNIFKEYEEPFDKLLVEQANTLLIILKDTGYIEDLQGLDFFKLKFYLYVTYLRNQNSHSDFTDLKELCEISSEKIKMLKEYLKTFLVNHDNIDDEVLALVNYLKVNNLLVDTFIPEITESLTESFLIISSYKELVEYNDGLQESLTPLFIKSLYFGNQLLDSQFYADLTVFQENYYEIYQLCLSICANDKFISIFGNQLENKSFLMSMLLKLIHNLPLQLLQVPVRVTIDFSIGKEYNSFISLMVDNLPFSNLVVNNIYSRETDIYLSDILTNKVHSKYIIWNSPPTAKDWEIFGNLVTTIKKEKNNNTMTH